MGETEGGFFVSGEVPIKKAYVFLYVILIPYWCLDIS